MKCFSCHVALAASSTRTHQKYLLLSEDLSFSQCSVSPTSTRLDLFHTYHRSLSLSFAQIAYTVMIINFPVMLILVTTQIPLSLKVSPSNRYFHSVDLCSFCRPSRDDPLATTRGYSLESEVTPVLPVSIKCGFAGRKMGNPRICEHKRKGLTNPGSELLFTRWQVILIQTTGRPGNNRPGMCGKTIGQAAGRCLKQISV